MVFIFFDLLLPFKCILLALAASHSQCICVKTDTRKLFIVVFFMIIFLFWFQPLSLKFLSTMFFASVISWTQFHIQSKNEVSKRIAVTGIHCSDADDVFSFSKIEALFCAEWIAAESFVQEVHTYGSV